MNYKYERKVITDYTKLDKNLKLSLFHASEIAQNVATEFFATFKSDNYTEKREHNVVWVLTKSKFHFANYPIWREECYAKTYTTLVKAIRAQIEVLVENNEGFPFFTTKYEFCPIDIDTRKIRKIDTLNYPKDMDIAESRDKEEFSKLSASFNNEHFVYSQIVHTSDIDFSNHTNNTIYIKYILDSLHSDFLDDKLITDFEIHYLNESREDDVLDIYKIVNEDHTVDFLIKKNATEIVRAKIKYRLLHQ